MQLRRNGNGMTESRAGGSQREAYLGETLYHFMGHGSDDDLMYIFDSIARRGLLMTVGDKGGNLDRFSFDLIDGRQQSYEIMQKARVCFTDIPRDKLYDHSGEYGRFGIGISRRTIIRWGGNPVFYIPNHLDGPVTSVMGCLMHGLYQAGSWLPALEQFCSGYWTPYLREDIGGGANDVPLLLDGTMFSGEERRSLLLRGRDAVEQVLSYVKQMSHSDVNDYSYLYEREWRIVAGVAIQGQTLTRELTPEEKTELTGKRPRWQQPVTFGIKPLYHREHTGMIDLFKMFNGVGGVEVAKEITDILVPHFSMVERVEQYIQGHRDLFADVAPSVSELTC
jgi:hypothetical protein